MSEQDEAMDSVWLVLHTDSWTSQGDEVRMVGMARSRDDAEAMAREDVRVMQHGPVTRLTFEFQEWAPGETAYRRSIEVVLDLQAGT